MGKIREQLRRLARRFPGKLISKKGKFDYVDHAVITQVLLAEVGSYDWELVREIHESDGTISGAVWRLTCTIDGEKTVTEEVGDVENPQSKKTNGARAKDASSDALKRCAMRRGLGLHLWAQENYFLDRALEAEKDKDPVL